MAVTPTLPRNAGPIALAAGAALVVVDIGRYITMDLDHRVEASMRLGFQITNIAYFFAFVGLAVALVALYWRQHEHAGRLGLTAFLFALLGTMTQAGNMWFDGFAGPWLAEVAPQVFAGEKTVTLQLGGLLSYALFALGWILFGIAVLRARSAPVLIGLALVVGGVLGFNSGLAPYGIPIGLAVAAMGGWILRSDRMDRTAPARVAAGA
ncbi:hypothetical protein [Pseudonocardia sp. TRM90224]|uniref:hypothetical protein n=1 Tax=Pseudonocardia sp. TRM90224 TaxID=2812678 RepID=UPI001E52304A|nr:hypothetical protein [Pseudonocardia sp. TRM90224]